MHQPLASFVAYISYSQIMIYDSSVSLPGCAWTERHTQQGFARRSKNACVRTMLEYGFADVAVRPGPYVAGQYQRVIQFPLELPSGIMVIDGPDDAGRKCAIELPKGIYRVVVAQIRLNVDREMLDIFVQQIERSDERSLVLVTDGDLAPSETLLEDAEVA